MVDLRGPVRWWLVEERRRVAGRRWLRLQRHDELYDGLVGLPCATHGLNGAGAIADGRAISVEAGLSFFCLLAVCFRGRRCVSAAVGDTTAKTGGCWIRRYSSTRQSTSTLSTACFIIATTERSPIRAARRRRRLLVSHAGVARALTDVRAGRPRRAQQQQLIQDSSCVIEQLKSDARWIHLFFFKKTNSLD